MAAREIYRKKSGQVVKITSLIEKCNVVLEGYGFFIHHHLILCPAYLVLVSPFLTLSQTKKQETKKEKTFKQYPRKVDSIIITYFTGNEEKVTNATLKFVDGSANVALLSVEVQSKEFFDPSDDDLEPGDFIYCITPRTACEGVIVNEDYFDPEGEIHNEIIEISFKAELGAPILNRDEYVVAMSLGKFCIPIKFIKEVITPCLIENMTRQIEVEDFMIARKGYIGLVYLADDAKYLYLQKNPLNGKYESQNILRQHNTISGLIVEQLPGGIEDENEEEVEYVYVPDSKAEPPYLPTQDSEINTLLNHFDLIVRLDNYEFNEINFVSLIRNKLPGQLLRLEYRKKSNAYTELYRIDIHVNSYPYYLDYPFYMKKLGYEYVGEFIEKFKVAI